MLSEKRYVSERLDHFGNRRRRLPRDRSSRLAGCAGPRQSPTGERRNGNGRHDFEWIGLELPIMLCSAAVL